MITEFQIAQINFVLSAYHRLYISYYSATWQLINLGMTPTETAKLIKHVDRGFVPPFSKPQLHEILSSGNANDR